MSELILTREEIARRADLAAVRASALGTEQQNPYPPGSDAAAAWEASFQRYLQAYTAPEGEASA